MEQGDKMLDGAEEADELKSYKGIQGYDHQSVKHSAGEYVRGKAHTNGIESFWALLKRGYHGVYHWVSSSRDSTSGNSSPKRKCAP